MKAIRSMASMLACSVLLAVLVCLLAPITGCKKEQVEKSDPSAQMSKMKQFMQGKMKSGEPTGKTGPSSE